MGMETGIITMRTTLLGIQGQVEELDKGKELEILDLATEINTETLPGTAREIEIGEKEDQIGAPAETEGEAMELQEQGSMTMGIQEGPERVARRPIVWWGLL